VSLYIHLPFCEALCSFCGCHKILSSDVALMKAYAGRLLEEWRLHKVAAGSPLSVATLHLGGGTPTAFPPALLDELLSGLAADFAPSDFEGSFEAHPNSTREAHLDVLARHGFTRMSLGVQDYDPHVQDAVGRVQTRHVVDGVVDAARRRGFSGINFDLIHGLPLQTEESMARTFSTVVQQRPDRVAFYGYAHVPDLKPAQGRFEAMGLPDERQRQRLFSMGEIALMEAGYVSLGMDHFALPSDALARAASEGRLHRNFMGYTTAPEKVLIGLGVSSIGEVDGSLYAQNSKGLAEWGRAVDSGALPIVRGHVMSPEDIERGARIRDILCRGVTTWTGAFRTACEDDSAATRERLEEFAREGLLEIKLGRVRATSSGRRKLREICTAFDASLTRGGSCK
jgi:oxygen-independent coproporphyrinogen-3 oxidase